MWRTPSGERVMRGCEWDLFREGLSTLWDLVEDSFGEFEVALTGVRVFDGLQPPTKLAMMAFVGTALNDEHEASPKLTALTEGTFAAVYAVILQWIDLEIDLGRADSSTVSDTSSMRDLVLAALHEARRQWDELHAEPGSVLSDAIDDQEVAALLLEPDSEDREAWADLLDEVMDQVLWGDRDFEEEELMLDVNPDLGRDLKAQLGIDEDYFTGVAPEPSERELESIRETLRTLCGRPKRRQDAPD